MSAPSPSPPPPPPPERSLTISSIPTELRDLIWGHVLEDCQLWVGTYGPQPWNGATVRRHISEDPFSTGLVRFPGHVMQYVHPVLSNEFQQHLARMTFHNLTLDEVRLIPPGLFNGIVNLALGMDQAILLLQVTVPNIQPTFSSILPNTSLLLTHAPSVRKLDIYWDTTVVEDTSVDEVPIRVLLARLGYFRRQFRAVMLYEAYEGTNIACSGTLLDENSFRNHTACNDSDFANFQNHLNFLAWCPVTLIMPSNHFPPHTPEYAAVIEAHSWHNFVPLGWHRVQRVLRPTDSYFHLAAPQRLVPRPWDT